MPRLLPSNWKICTHDYNVGFPVAIHKDGWRFKNKSILVLSSNSYSTNCNSCKKLCKDHIQSWQKKCDRKVSKNSTSYPKSSKSKYEEWLRQECNLSTKLTPPSTFSLDKDLVLCRIKLSWKVQKGYTDTKKKKKKKTLNTLTVKGRIFFH